MLTGLSAGSLVLLLGGSMLAGFIDALIGGGGLILIPLLLLGSPGMPATSALATNKLASICGTSSAAVSMLRRIPIDKKLAAVAVPLAIACAAGGATLASWLSAELLRPIVIVLLVVVGLYVAFRPDFGKQAGAGARPSRARWALALITVRLIATYDGFFGPGTGMFLIIAFTALLSRSFVESAVLTKVVNASTNLGALIVFAVGGHVWWTLGLALAVMNIIGAQLGARLVLSKGTGLVRAALLALVLVMVSKLTFDLLAG